MFGEPHLCQPVLMQRVANCNVGMFGDGMPGVGLTNDDTGE